jgi:hypothetical protein
MMQPVAHPCHAPAAASMCLLCHLGAMDAASGASMQCFADFALKIEQELAKVCVTEKKHVRDP